MPLFYDHLDTLFDYVAGVPLVFDAQVDEAATERLTLIRDYYDARAEAMKTPSPGVAPYKPLKPSALYLTPNEWRDRVAAAPSRGSRPSPRRRVRSGPSSIARAAPAAASRPSAPTRPPACSTRRWPMCGSFKHPAIT